MTQDQLAALAVHQQGFVTLPATGEVVALLERHLPVTGATATRGDGRQTEERVEGMVPAMADQHRLADPFRTRRVDPCVCPRRVGSRRDDATAPQRPDERQRHRSERPRAAIRSHVSDVPVELVSQALDTAAGVAGGRADRQQLLERFERRRPIALS